MATLLFALGVITTGANFIGIFVSDGDIKNLVAIAPLNFFAGAAVAHYLGF